MKHKTGRPKSSTDVDSVNIGLDQKELKTVQTVMKANDWSKRKATKT